ncbi:type I secretion system permease/ATPase [Candidatus Saccharibacteria bacterium]|nr:MAG: type I secretion system permease/ATPase [Candidatus Saccharibacteria bacterium]
MTVQHESSDSHSSSRRGDQSSRSSAAPDAGLYCFVNIARFHNIPADPDQITHALAIGAEGMGEADMLRAAKSFKLKAKAATVEYDKLAKLTLPAIVGLKTKKFAILAKIDGDKLLLLLPDGTAPTTMTRTEFMHQWTGRVVLFAQRFWKDAERKFDVKWFIPTIIKYKKPLLEVLAAAFALQIVGVFTPILTQVVIDKALAHHSTSTLDVIVFGLAVIALFEAAMGIARNYIFTHTTSRIDTILSSRLFRHLFALPLRYFETRRVGDTTARVMELEKVRAFLTGAPMTTLIDLSFMFVYIAVMLVYSTTLTWVVLASLPCFALLAGIITPLLRNRVDEKFNTGAESQAYLVESISGAQTIKSFALEPQLQKNWEGRLSNYVRAAYKLTILGGNANALGQLIQKLADIAILWFGAHLVMSGDLTIGGLIAFRMLSGRVSGPILRLVQSWQEFQQTGISIKRLGDIFNTKTEPTMDPTKSRLPSIRGDIRFDKVRFRYNPESAEVIRDMTFGVRPGDVVGIVGRSGSGKSTISKLIQRLYVPEAGKVLIDGVDTAMTDPAWLRRQVGVVLQESFLFNASVRDNIAVHVPAASMDDIVRVARMAGAHEFILELAEGYDTVVGEHGEGLSGGQKQRIAIARALLHDPRILIFDEATSALDYESESIIQRNLRQITNGRTVLIIAHRLSTLKHVDKIMTIDRGKLIEYSSPSNLLEADGLYAHLHRQQAGGPA